MTPLADSPAPTAAAVAFTLLKLTFIGYVSISFVTVALYTARQIRAGRLLDNAHSPAPYQTPQWLWPILLGGLASLMVFPPLFFAFAATAVARLSIEDEAARAQFGWARLAPRKLARWTLLVCGAVIFIEMPLMPLMENIMDALHIPHPEQLTVITFRNYNHWEQILPFMFQAVILSPLIEEFFFRGLLFTWLKNHTNLTMAVFMSAGVFAVVHLNLAAIVPLWVLGMVLAMAYQHTGSLLLPICVHGCFNLVTALSLLLEKGNG